MHACQLSPVHICHKTHVCVWLCGCVHAGNLRLSQRQERSITRQRHRAVCGCVHDRAVPHYSLCRHALGQRGVCMSGLCDMQGNAAVTSTCCCMASWGGLAILGSQTTTPHWSVPRARSACCMQVTQPKLAGPGRTAAAPSGASSSTTVSDPALQGQQSEIVIADRLRLRSHARLALSITCMHKHLYTGPFTARSSQLSCVHRCRDT